MSTPSYGWIGAIQPSGGWIGAIQPDDPAPGGSAPPIAAFAIGSSRLIGCGISLGRKDLKEDPTRHNNKRNQAKPVKNSEQPEKGLENVP